MPVPEADPTTRSRREVLTDGEITTVRVLSVYDAVQMLRPEFLRVPTDARYGEAGNGAPVVYLNGIYQGGLQTLRLIAASAVTEIRYVTARAATDWYGPYRRSRAPVIAVRTGP